MLMIIVGGGIVAFLFALFGKIALYIGIPIIVLCLLLPIEGYDRKKCQVTELLPIKTDDEKTYYVVCDKDEVKYAFDNSDEYDLNGGAYEEAIVKGNIKVYDSKSCKKAILKKYTTKPNREVLTFALLAKTKVEYVFYIPNNTVKYEGVKKL